MPRSAEKFQISPSTSQKVRGKFPPESRGGKDSREIFGGESPRSPPRSGGNDNPVGVVFMLSEEPQ